MSENRADTRTRLVEAAAHLFRQRGYHGVGVAEILSQSAAPKGSLYHHFPRGKADLAIAAADWASDGMLRIIDDAFRAAPTYAEGAKTLCFKLAKLFDLSGQWDGCPVSSTLFDGPQNTEFRGAADRITASWIARVAAHGERLGLPGPEAEQASLRLLIAIQGAWNLARARSSSEPLRLIASMGMV